MSEPNRVSSSTSSSRSDGPALTFEKLAEIMKGIPKAPVFLVAHWLNGSVVLKCERDGREEVRLSPAAWAKFCSLTVKAEKPDPFAAPVTHEEKPPNDVLIQMLLDPELRPHVGRWRMMPPAVNWLP